MLITAARKAMVIRYESEPLDCRQFGGTGFVLAPPAGCRVLNFIMYDSSTRGSLVPGTRLVK